MTYIVNIQTDDKAMAEEVRQGVIAVVEGYLDKSPSYNNGETGCKASFGLPEDPIRVQVHTVQKGGQDLHFDIKAKGVDNESLVKILDSELKDKPANLEPRD